MSTERNEQPGSAFDRLPEDLKEEIRKKERVEAEQGEEYRRKLQQLTWCGSALGGVIAGLLAAASISHPVMWVVVGLYGAAATFYIIGWRLDHIKGILIFGAGSGVLLLLGCFVGLVVFGPALMFMWLFYLTGGALIAMGAEGHRAKLDGY
jgi:hypothetical protein